MKETGIIMSGEHQQKVLKEIKQEGSDIHIPIDVGKLPSDEVKAIKIRGQLHAIKRNTMHGYKTVCGRVGSFGHTVYMIDRDEMSCVNCRNNA